MDLGKILENMLEEKVKESERKEELDRKIGNLAKDVSNQLIEISNEYDAKLSYSSGMLLSIAIGCIGCAIKDEQEGMGYINDVFKFIDSKKVAVTWGIASKYTSETEGKHDVSEGSSENVGSPE